MFSWLPSSSKNSSQPTILSDSDALKWHGTRGSTTWAAPKLVAQSDEANRADQGNTTKANEYLDEKDVLEQKMEIVANLIRSSKFCCAYTGAGLSSSSGIPDYATKAKDTIIKAPKLKSNLEAEPTYAHCVLTALERAGLLHHYVQQNHDGLPQKSGFPQEKINEIHGAWFDPSNPVVQFGGHLRGDLFDWMAEAEKQVDLCLCLGTSLSGMNADRMANTPAKQSLKKPPKALGTIVINIQQTPLDSHSVVRVWAKLDDAFAILAKKLNLPKIRPFPATLPSGDVFEIPYDSTGKKNDSVRMTLDLRIGSKVMIPIEGAMNYNATGEVVGIRQGHYDIHFREPPNGWLRPRLFGNWWVAGALKGTIPRIPIVNIDPVIKIVENSEDVKGKGKAPSSDLENNNNNAPSQLPTAIEVIQSHTYLPYAKEGDNDHNWGLRIKAEHCEFVESVVWMLHPTFHSPKVTCTEAPFKIARLGWGTFNVGVTITLKQQYGGTVLKANHELAFDEDSDLAKITVVPTE